MGCESCLGRKTWTPKYIPSLTLCLSLTCMHPNEKCTHLSTIGLSWESQTLRCLICLQFSMSCVKGHTFILYNRPEENHAHLAANNEKTGWLRDRVEIYWRSQDHAATLHKSTRLSWWFTELNEQRGFPVMRLVGWCDINTVYLIWKYKKYTEVLAKQLRSHQLLKLTFS